MRECPHCHGPRDVCEDPERVWHMHKSICHKTVALEAARRIHADEYESQQWHDGDFKRWSAKQSAEFPNHFMDGVSIWVADEPQHPTT